MTALEIAPFLKEYGPWALCALLIVVIKVLDSRNNALVEKVLNVASASQSAAEKVASAIRDLEATESTTGTAVQTLAREQEVELQNLRHALANYHAAFSAAYDRLSRNETRDRQ